MSYLAATAPVCSRTSGPVELVIEPVAKSLGEFSVRRVLPSGDRKMVGPFIFFDHMGPADFPPGVGIQVRPHPHIGIATITYLFEGEIIHRDNLGFVQPIRPGAVNLMTAGRGIVHSERAGADLDSQSRLHGIQSWIALPLDDEEREPAFVHYAASALPGLEIGGASVRIIMGSAFGAASPVMQYSPTLYLEARMPAGTELTLPNDGRELAAYVVSGEIRIEGSAYPGGVMAVAAPGRTLTVRAESDSLLMVVGGDPVGDRHIWWNFVSSSEARIERAKSDWTAGRFEVIPGETEFIPLPD